MGTKFDLEILKDIGFKEQHSNMFAIDLAKGIQLRYYINMKEFAFVGQPVYFDTPKQVKNFVKRFKIPVDDGPKVLFDIHISPVTCLSKQDLRHFIIANSNDINNDDANELI